MRFYEIGFLNTDHDRTFLVPTSLKIATLLGQRGKLRGQLMPLLRDIYGEGVGAHLRAKGALRLPVLHDGAGGVGDPDDPGLVLGRLADPPLDGPNGAAGPPPQQVEAPPIA